MSTFAVSEAPRASVVVGYRGIGAERIPEGLRWAAKVLRGLDACAICRADRDRRACLSSFALPFYGDVIEIIAQEGPRARCARGGAAPSADGVDR